MKTDKAKQQIDDALEELGTGPSKSWLRSGILVSIAVQSRELPLLGWGAGG